MAIKSFKYLSSPEEVAKFLALPDWKTDVIEVEMTSVSTGNVESTWSAWQSVRTHKMFLLERQLIEQGADPRILEDYRQMAYEEGSDVTSMEYAEDDAGACI
jgi:hypothetical protein